MRARAMLRVGPLSNVLKAAGFLALDRGLQGGQFGWGNG